MGNVASLSSAFRPLTVVLTGASSFTGMWFAKALSERGHRVVAVLAQPISEYEGVRRSRVRLLAERAEILDAAPMGSKRLQNGLSRQPSIDCVLWHHAHVGAYLSSSFPLAEAISLALAGVPETGRLLAEKGCRLAIITHSVFESGRGSPPGGPPIGLYGVSKRAIGDALAIHMHANGIENRHFVIANPVGPLEEPRLVAYLLRRWKSQMSADLMAPHWIRDNIPVDLLAHAYADFVEIPSPAPEAVFTPSWWTESNWEWARRVGEKLAPRMGLRPLLERADVLDDSQPSRRIGVERLTPSSDWDEENFWDGYADFYRACL